MSTDPTDGLAELGRGAARNLGRLGKGVSHLLWSGNAPVAPTPKDVVWRRDRAQLWHYRSNKPRRRPPVLIVNSLIGRSYVLDLCPGNSIVAGMLDAGIDVYMVDWGVPDERDADNDFGTYLDYYLPQAVDALLRDASADEFTIMGYCAGGVLAMMLLATTPQLPARNLVTLATPVDFTGMGLYSRLLAQPNIDPTAALDATGNVPGADLRRLMRLTRPTEDANTYVALLQLLWHDHDLTSFQAMSRWAEDQVPFPGALYLQAFELMRDNALISGTYRVNGRAVDLRNITCPYLQVLAEQDHITPESSVTPAADLVGTTDVRQLRLKAGHVGMLASRTAAKVTLPGIVDWIVAHSEQKNC